MAAFTITLPPSTQTEIDGLCADLRAAVQKYFDQGYASRVSDPVDAKYFLAHHGVYKGKKLRVVYDAAAPFKGKCLNHQWSSPSATFSLSHYSFPRRRCRLGFRN